MSKGKASSVFIKPLDEIHKGLLKLQKFLCGGVLNRCIAASNLYLSNSESLDYAHNGQRTTQQVFKCVDDMDVIEAA